MIRCNFCYDELTIIGATVLGCNCPESLYDYEGRSRKQAWLRERAEEEAKNKRKPRKKSRVAQNR